MQRANWCKYFFGYGLNGITAPDKACRFVKRYLYTYKKIKLEVEVVRVKITLACTECKQRNYNMTKDKKTHPDRMETKKYCRFCKSHTSHKETK